MTLSLLIALLLKSSLIAAAGLAVAQGIARRPVERVLALRATLVLLLVLPLAMAVLPALALEVLPTVPTPGPAEPLWSGTTAPVAGVALSGELRWPSAIVVIGWLWAVGALVLVGRVAAGVWTLAVWTRQAEAVRCPDWTATLIRLGGRCPPRLSASPRVAGPLSWGLSPGAILIDRASLSAPDTATAILSHELAHLRRCDWLFLMLSRLALALFWFNPLVWKVAADLAAASEDAADAEAVRHVDRHAYARTLIGLAAVPNSPVALAMAADPRSLKRRITRLMTASRTPRRPLAIGLSIAALVVVATPLAALELHDRAPIAPLPPVPPMVTAPPAAPIAGLPAMLQIAAPPAPPAPPEPHDAVAPPAPPAQSWGAPPVPPVPPAPPAPPSGHGRHNWVVTENGVSRQATPAERAEFARAQRQAHEARIHARAAGAEARAHAAQARTHARAAAHLGADAQGHAEHAREMARTARQQAMHARTNARVHMRGGADQMRQGAEHMRRAAAQLEDPAFRAEQIARAQSQGRTVTDAQLQAAAPRLRTRADALEQRAARLATDAESAD